MRTFAVSNDRQPGSRNALDTVLSGKLIALICWRGEFFAEGDPAQGNDRTCDSPVSVVNGC